MKNKNKIQKNLLQKTNLFYLRNFQENPTESYNQDTHFQTSPKICAFKSSTAPSRVEKSSDGNIFRWYEGK